MTYADRLDQFLSEGRLIRNAWRNQTPDGRETACLLSAMFPEVRDSVTQCPAGTIPLWLSYQATLALILALIAVLAFRVGVSPRAESAPTLALAVTLGLVVALAALAAARVWFSVSLAWWAVAFWSLPAATAALALSRLRGWRQALGAWGLAGLLGSSAALVTAWSGRVEARMVSAEEQLRHLETQEDPYLNFLLYRLVDIVEALDAAD